MPKKKTLDTKDETLMSLRLTKNNENQERGFSDETDTKREESPKSEEEVTISKEDLAQLEKQNKLADEYLDHLRRLKAEFENYKKREEKQRAEFIKLANEELVAELLPVMDSFDRALNGEYASADLEDFIQGMKLIWKQLEDVLTKNGLARIETIGKTFDPRVHEAIMQIESDEYPEDTVVQELRKGYVFNNKVISPAQVAVSKSNHKKVEKEEDNYAKGSGN